MPVDVPWGDFTRLKNAIEEIAYGHVEEAGMTAAVVLDIIIDTADRALTLAVTEASVLDAGVRGYIDAEIAEVTAIMHQEIDLIYDQLDLWLDDVETWITVLVTEVTTSIEENAGLGEEGIEEMGTIIYEGVNTSIESTGSWIGDVYDNVKTSMFDTTSDLIDKLAGLVEMIKEAPQIIINKMATELVPAEAGQWLLTAGNVLTGLDMGAWLNKFQGTITGAGDELLTFDLDEVKDNFLKAFDAIKKEMPQLMGGE